MPHQRSSVTKLEVLEEGGVKKTESENAGPPQVSEWGEGEGDVTVLRSSHGLWFANRESRAALCWGRP